MKGEEKINILSAEDRNLLYEGQTKKDERTKQALYDGAGYLFNNETKCFFKGTWSNGLKVCGIETFPNGDVFEGSYLEDKFHGQGLIYNNENGRYRFEGAFFRGQKHGQGEEKYITGGTYQGQFRHGVKHGEGKLSFADSSYYLGDFQKGQPNGFGLHVAYTKSRIVYVFQISRKEVKQEDVNAGEKKQEIQHEYYYEGDFVDGYKHGIGRLCEPSGSYFYGYWEYNKPMRNIIYYNADEHNWKILNQNGRPLNLKEMVENKDTDFYKILESSDWKNIPITSSGYPDYKLDGYKSLIDEKGLKREPLEDPQFVMSEIIIQVRDEIGSPIAAPTDFKRIANMDYKKSGFKLFLNEIKPGSLNMSDQYSCQQLTCVLDAMTYHSFLFQKIFTRKYDSDIGFYILKFYFQNEWKEYIVDDLVPILKSNDQSIFSNSKDNELGWTILFKCFAKMNQSFQYFETCETQEAENLLTLLTGMPSKTISMASIFTDQDRDGKSKKINKVWKSITDKHQKTQIRICYLRKEQTQKGIIPQNYAYHLVDSISNSDDKFVMMKSLIQSHAIKSDLIQSYAIKSDLQDDNNKSKHYQTIVKLKDRNIHTKDDERYFILTFQEFIEYFDNVIILAGTKYQTQNHLEINPKDSDLQINQFKLFTRFCINVPSSMLFCVTQAHMSDKKNEYGEFMESDTYLPLRIVLAKEKDLYTNKNQIKKSVVNFWNDESQKKQSKLAESKSANIFSKSVKEQQSTIESHQQVIRKTESKSLPYKYVFGRGQKKTKQIYKEVTLQSGIYLLLIQVEQSGDGKNDGKTASSQQLQSLEKLKFHLTIHAQYLLQLHKIHQINQFQKIVYESAVINAERYFQMEGKEPKFFSKVDLSERENGSSDLIIIQYFLKNEGTYLQYLRNKSTNKIWRQKLYFRLENMVILNQVEVSKIDLQLNTSDNRSELVVIQQIGAKPYNLEGGEGICIIDIQNDTKEGQEEDSEASPDQIKQIMIPVVTQKEESPTSPVKKSFKEGFLSK